MVDKEENKVPEGKAEVNIDEAALENIRNKKSETYPAKFIGELDVKQLMLELSTSKAKLEIIRSEKASKVAASKSNVKKHGKKAKEDIKQIEDLLEKKKNIVAIGSYVCGRLRESNPELARKLKCTLLKSNGLDAVHLLASSLLQLDDNEIGHALTKGIDISGEPLLDNDISIEDLNKHVRSEKEYYEVITNQLKLFAPKFRYFDRDFINDLFAERKSLYELKQIEYIKPPKNSMFTLEGFESYWKRSDIAKYLPNKCSDRTYMFSILNTVEKKLVDKMIEQFNKERFEEKIKQNNVIKSTKLGFGKKFTDAIANRFTRCSARRSITNKLSAACMEKERKERSKRTYSALTVKAENGIEHVFKDIRCKRIKKDEDQ
jgi:hypothetical protein